MLPPRVEVDRTLPPEAAVRHALGEYPSDLALLADNAARRALQADDAVDEEHLLAVEHRGLAGVSRRSTPPEAFFRPAEKPLSHASNDARSP